MAELPRGAESDDGWIASAGFRWICTEPDHQKSIYIRFNDTIGSRRSSSGSSGGSSGSSSIGYEEGESQWYVIPEGDLFSSHPETEMERPLYLSSIPSLPQLYGCTSVFLYPRIYVIGGKSLYQPGLGVPGSRCVYSYDVTADPPTDYWEEMKPMQCERITPSAFALDGKIYVFGGINCSCCFSKSSPPSNCYNTKPFLEIYDPTTDTWEGRLEGASVSLSSIVARLSALFEDTRGNKHLLLHTGLAGLRTYDIGLDLVTPRDMRFDVSSLGTNAVVDGILFCCSSRTVIGYDMTSAHWSGLGVAGLTFGKVVPDFEDWGAVSLLNIGGKRLGILWTLTRADDDDFLLMCSVVKVDRITYSNGQPGLRASVENFKRYSYCAIDGFYMDCLAF